MSRKSKKKNPKFYDEETLLGMVQEGKAGFRFYVTHLTKELRDEYFAFIEARNLRDNNIAAEEFIAYKDEQLLAAVEEGNV